MDRLDILILQATIRDLKHNPNACTATMIGRSSVDGEPILRSVPDQQLRDFIEYLYKQNFIDIRYLLNYEKVKHQTVDEIDAQGAMTCITWIIRGDLFSSGLLYECVKDGTFGALLEKLFQLVVKDRVARIAQQQAQVNTASQYQSPSA